MHDIDRTFMEYPAQPAQPEYAQGPFEFAEGEWDASGEVFGETELMELAADLLEVTDEAELDQFIGGLIGKAGRALGAAIRSPLGQKLGGILKGAARQALPQIGSAIGGHFGGSTGARLGGQVASGIASKFGLETEGLSHEDEAYEVAKQYVRFAADAVKNAAGAPAGDPAAVARAAATAAARRLAPGLLPGGGGGAVAGRPVAGPAGQASGGRAGRWVRRGNRIILYGV